MAFIREKSSRGRKYFYLVECRREGGKVRQRTLAYLGPVGSLEDAIAYWQAEAERLQRMAEKAQRQRDEARARVHPAWIERNGGEVPEMASRRHWAAKICKHYWRLAKYAARLEQRAGQDARRAEILRSLCSACNVAAGKTIAGTTPADTPDWLEARLDALLLGGAA
jgi:hypothetical protein